MLSAANINYLPKESCLENLPNELNLAILNALFPSDFALYECSHKLDPAIVESYYEQKYKTFFRSYAIDDKTSYTVAFKTLYTNHFATLSTTDKKLFEAVAVGDLSLVKKMIKRLSIEKLSNMKDSTGLPLIHWAVKTGHLNILQELYSVTNNINSIDKDGNTLLHTAVIAENSEIFEYLCNFNISNSSNKAGLRSFDLAVQTGQHAIKDALIKKFKIYINTPVWLINSTSYSNNKHYQDIISHTTTLLYDAIERDDINAIKKLFEDYPCINVNHGLSKFESSTFQITPRQDNDQVTKSKKTEQISPLALAITMNKLDIVKLLIFKGADVNTGIIKRERSHYGLTKNKETKTPLCLAVESKNHEIMEFLIKSDANINQGFKKTEKNYFRHVTEKSPLFIALENHFVAGIKVLQKHNAEAKFIFEHVYQEDSENNTKHCLTNFSAGLSSLLNSTQRTSFFTFSADFRYFFTEAKKFDAETYDALIYDAIKTNPKVSVKLPNEFYPTGKHWQIKSNEDATTENNSKDVTENNSNEIKINLNYK